MTSSSDHQTILPALQKQASSASPPVSISSQSHLDPACYVKGSHLLTIEANVVIHPRCRLYTDQGKITVHAGSILLERCIVGVDKELNPEPKTGQDKQDDAGTPDSDSSAGPTSNKDAVIGPYAYLHSSVKLQPPCKIGEYSVLESGVVVHPSCSIGSHSKICAGITLPRGTIVPDWTVVYGLDGRMRRRRKPNIAEESRMEGMNRERQGVEAILKMNAAKNLNSSGGGSKNKRESIIRTESSKG